MRGFIKSMFNFFGPKGRHTSRARLAVMTTVVLVGEMLEKRECKAGAVSFASGILRYDTSTDEQVVLGSNTAGKVTINGAATNYLARNVRTLVITATNADGVTVNLSGMSSRAFSRLRGTDITTGAGNDTFFGSFAADDVFAGLGDDTFNCSNGFDIFDGGDGYDTLKLKMSGGYLLATDQYFSSSSSGGCRFGCLFDIDLIDVDSSASSRNRLTVNTSWFTGDVNIVGTKFDDFVTTGPGNDIVVGGGGKDRISTNGGNDVVFASGGVILTGAGDDFVDATEATSGVRIKDGLGDDTYNGSGFADTIIGLAGNDNVSAGAGNDNIDYTRSTSGDVNISGEDGNDTIKAGTGNAQLSGGAGDDDIYVGPGLSFVFGDDGRDFFDTSRGLDFLLFDPDNGFWNKERTIFTPLP